ncbi:putative minor extracellular protease vpr [Diaporthe ampelina]|uniref:Putative minor extracellular protease vpr n=1 Tax=Diaporthe ampelina TaxID=1214573 RepID=A0A0G2H9F2_9PEZI|nr:putative minor extracellular protease vpr [Diaporthe ampelina]
MAKLSSALLLCAALVASVNARGIERVYIVQMESAPVAGQSSIARRSLHENSLRSVTSRDTLLYSYSSAMNGYAAKLTDSQARDLMAQPGVKSVSRQNIYQLHTTHTPEFLGLDQAELLGQQGTVFSGATDTGNTTNAESDLIIGVFDTGVWPESASYDDTGLPPIPGRWKGSCVEGEEFTAANCNNKLIGAKWYSKALEAAMVADNGTAYNFTGAYKSARDPDGHGTHTSSTAAGAVVQGASIFGQASGTARGMASGARVAMYKVCWPNVGCASADMLAAFDDAIEDGIDVASLSIGGGPSLAADPLYVGAFSAMAKGIFVSMSGGNSGPSAGTVSNNVPWVLTVGASTQDREFPATIVLGDGQNFTGKSLSVNEDGTLPAFQELPLILASNAASGNITNNTDASLCLAGSLSPTKVAGKIVVCVRGGDIARVAKGQNVKDAGGAAMVLVNTEETGEDILADTHVLPAVHLGAADGASVLAYAKSADATAALDVKGTVLGVEAPLMAAFSSRGPNYPAPDLLKPDITGPGVEILAAWPDNVGTTELPEDTRRVKFNVISGTSMSCPHLSGIAAFIMARRPDWSAAAIRSALMTSAYTATKGGASTFRDEATKEPATPFDYGNGHVDVAAALDPGLIYDLKTEDYLDFLCAVDPTTEYVQGISGTNHTCSPDKVYSQYDLNYPSFAAGYDTTTETGPKTVNFTRTVTNVGGGAGTYRVNVSVSDPGLVQVSVDPEELTFAAALEQKSFVVSATLAAAGAGAESGKNAWGRLVWSDGSHTVGSSLGFVWGDLASLAVNGSRTASGDRRF